MKSQGDRFREQHSLVPFWVQKLYSVIFLPLLLFPFSCDYLPLANTSKNHSADVKDLEANLFWEIAAGLYWALLEIEYAIMRYQVTMWPELPEPLGVVYPIWPEIGSEEHHLLSDGNGIWDQIRAGVECVSRLYE